MTALAPVGVVRAVYDSFPISGPGATYPSVADGEFFLFSIVGTSGSSVVFMEKETTTTTSKMRALVGGASITLTVTGWDGSALFLNLGTTVSGSGTSWTATVSTED
jgi:hypothetical protein